MRKELWICQQNDSLGRERGGCDIKEYAEDTDRGVAREIEPIVNRKKLPAHYSPTTPIHLDNIWMA